MRAGFQAPSPAQLSGSLEMEMLHEACRRETQLGVRKSFPDELRFELDSKAELESHSKWRQELHIAENFREKRQEGELLKKGG